MKIIEEEYQKWQEDHALYEYVTLVKDLPGQWSLQLQLVFVVDLKSICDMILYQMVTVLHLQPQWCHWPTNYTRLCQSHVHKHLFNGLNRLSESHDT